jgi:hypothetical protein
MNAENPVQIDLFGVSATRTKDTRLAVVRPRRRQPSAPGRLSANQPWRVPRTSHTPGHSAVSSGHSRAFPAADQDHRRPRSARRPGDRTSKLVMRVRFPSSAIYYYYSEKFFDIIFYPFTLSAGCVVPWTCCMASSSCAALHRVPACERACCGLQTARERAQRLTVAFEAGAQTRRTVARRATVRQAATADSHSWPQVTARLRMEEAPWAPHPPRVAACDRTSLPSGPAPRPGAGLLHADRARSRCRSRSAC